MERFQFTANSVPSADVADKRLVYINVHKSQKHVSEQRSTIFFDIK